MTNPNIPKRLIHSIMNTLNGNKVSINTFYGHSNNLSIHKGVRQGDPISPLLFNIVTVYIMDNLKKESKYYNYEMEGPLGDIDLSYCFYADDLLLISRDVFRMSTILARLNKICNELQMSINIDK